MGQDAGARGRSVGSQGRAQQGAARRHAAGTGCQSAPADNATLRHQVRYAIANSGLNAVRRLIRIRRSLATLERVALVSTRALSVLGLFALMVLAFITLANGLLRWLINQPIAGVVDVGALAIAIAVELLHSGFADGAQPHHVPAGVFDQPAPWSLARRLCRHRGGHRACADGLAILGLCRRTRRRPASAPMCSKFRPHRSGTRPT